MSGGNGATSSGRGKGQKQRQTSLFADGKRSQLLYKWNEIRPLLLMLVFPLVLRLV